MGFTSSLGTIRDYQDVSYIAVPLLITEGVGAISGAVSYTHLTLPTIYSV